MVDVNPLQKGAVDRLRTTHTPLHSGFRQSALDHPTALALSVGEHNVSYGELDARASALAATLEANAPDGPRLTAVFAHRSATAFAGVLSALYRGHGFVPLKRTFPPARTAMMLVRSGCLSMIVDDKSADQLDDVLATVTQQLTVLLPEVDDVSQFRTRWRSHRILGAADLVAGDRYTPKWSSADSLAYVLFTSGSTGTPKRVGITHRNIRHFIDAMVERYGIQSSDRIAQNTDMTFDPSVFSMFVAWERGASVQCPTGNALIKPGRFIRESEVTIWASVPLAAVFMKQFGELKPGSFPSVRISLFGGEALPVEVVEAWELAAPNSIIENVYGPTEATISCTAYRWKGSTGPGESESGIVPIGWPLPGMTVIVVNEALERVEDGEAGELLLAGPQIAPGYLGDPEKTQASFVRLSDGGDIYYRTGDRVRQMPNGGPLRFLGRMDSQIKIGGHRVELGEIEAAVRDVTGLDAVVALGWPPTVGGARAVDVFVAGDVDTGAIRQALMARLPRYMVPRRIHELDELPLNDNGKYDRLALRSRLEESS